MIDKKLILLLGILVIYGVIAFWKLSKMLLDVMQE